MPAIERFRPGVLIVSAGQDTLYDDPLGGMALRPEDFFVLTKLLVQATDCPLALVLEGGYGPSHGEAISCIFSALRSGHDVDADRITGVPFQSTRLTIAELGPHLHLIRQA